MDRQNETAQFGSGTTYKYPNGNTIMGVTLQEVNTGSYAILAAMAEDLIFQSGQQVLNTGSVFVENYGSKFAYMLFGICVLTLSSVGNWLKACCNTTATTLDKRST
jgi:hypothetical protein